MGEGLLRDKLGCGCTAAVSLILIVRILETFKWSSLDEWRFWGTLNNCEWF